MSFVAVVVDITAVIFIMTADNNLILCQKWRSIKASISHIKLSFPTY